MDMKVIPILSAVLCPLMDKHADTYPPEMRTCDTPDTRLLQIEKYGVCNDGNKCLCQQGEFHAAAVMEAVRRIG